MKINRPSKYYPKMGTNSNSSEFNEAVWNSVLISRGDIIKKFASCDYPNESAWHFTEDPINDRWVKFSFDGGISWPMKFQFRNQLVVPIVKQISSDEKGPDFLFSLSDYPVSVYDAARAGLITLVAIVNVPENLNTSMQPETYLTEGEQTEGEQTDGGPENSSLSNYENSWFIPLSRFRYHYETATQEINVHLLDELPSYTVALMLKIGVDGSNSNALAVSSPVYSTTTGAVPTIYDNTENGYGICNMLDARIPSITCLTKFEEINVLKLKVVCPDNEIPKNSFIELGFKCGNDPEFTEEIPVTGIEDWVMLKKIPKSLTGTMVIRRTFNDSSEKMKSLSVFITNIKMEKI
jgi:hypothetical protein